MKETTSAIGRNLLYYRKLRGMTQVQLSDLSGVRQNYISRIENGFTRGIHISRGVALAKALGITAEELISERDCSSSESRLKDEVPLSDRQGFSEPSHAGQNEDGEPDHC